jgi:anthranilate phosphoribosyltransferase
MAHKRPDDRAFGEWSLRRLLTEAVGSGYESADDMTRIRAREASEHILAVGDVAVDPATVTEAVLSGDRDDHPADAVVLDAAVRTYAGGVVAPTADGIGRARSAIAEGGAQDRMAALRGV